MASNDASLIVRIGANLDELHKGLLDSQREVDSFAVATGNLMSDAAEKIGQKIVELAKALPELLMRGSDVADLEENFKRLTAQVGLLGDSLLGTLRQGTHGTVDDFTLMQRVNKDLVAGLNLTEDQFGLLAKGAFALANATGVSVTQAMDTMNDALVKGKARGLEALTGVIDLKKAEEDYARTLGVTAGDLSEQGKLYADRMAMFGAVDAAIGRAGEQLDGYDEKVNQARTSWTNFLDELGKTLATSPVLIQALDGVKEIIQQAFGFDQKQLIAAINYAIDTLTISVVEFARGTVDAATEMGEAWHAVGVVFNTLYNWILQLEKGMLRTQEVALEVRQFLEPWNDWSQAVKDVQAHIAEVDQTIQANKASIAEHEAAEASWAIRGQELSDKFAALSLRLQQQRDATYASGTAAEWAGPKLQTMGAAAHDATGDVAGLTAAQREQAEMQQVLNQVSLVTFENQKKVHDQAVQGMSKVNDAIVAELNARKQLNEAQGLNINGERDWVKTLDAGAKATYDYQKALDELHKHKAEGIDQSAQETQLANQYVEALNEEASSQADVAESAGLMSPPINAANQAVGAMTNTLVLGIDNLEQLNAALSDFYDQFAGNSAGTPGTGSYGTMGPQGMPRFATGPKGDWFGLGMGGAISGRQSGGPVSSGQPYVVGERGPELFVPESSGAIVPNSGTVTNNFYITQPLGTPQAIAAAVGAAQMTSLKSRGERFRPNGV